MTSEKQEITHYIGDYTDSQGHLHVCILYKLRHKCSITKLSRGFFSHSRWNSHNSELKLFGLLPIKIFESITFRKLIKIRGLIFVDHKNDRIQLLVVVICCKQKQNWKSDDDDAAHNRVVKDTKWRLLNWLFLTNQLLVDASSLENTSEYQHKHR